jgi:thermitase
MKKEITLWVVAISIAAILSADLAGSQRFSPAGIGPARASAPSTASYVPGQVIVKFRDNISSAHQEIILRAYGSKKIRTLSGRGRYQLGVPAGYSVEETVSALAQNLLVEYAEPNYLVRASATPNDPLFNKQYALSNAGGTLLLPGSPIGKQGADIKATAGWEESKGSAQYLIAILDTGIDLLHPDLKEKCFSNGKDFVNDDQDASDDNGHGTVVAGIVGAETNNSEGIAGVAWNCGLLPVKVLDQDGVGQMDQIYDGIVWAADMVSNGVKVINISWGLDASANLLRDAVEYAYQKGVVVVAAAGNTGGQVQFPAAYDNFVLAVSATDYLDTRFTLSNTGSEIDVAAPGVDIMTTVPRGYYGPGSVDYGFWTGTSMAAPHVAGLAALIVSIKPFLTVDDIMNIIRFSADDVNSDNYPGKDEFLGYGRINIEKAIVPLIIETVIGTTPTAIR